MKRISKVLVGFLLSLCLVVPAFAIPVLDFRDGDAVGGLVYVNGTVQGVDIAMDALNASGTANDGLYDLSGAIAAPADPQDGTAAALNFNTSTGYISIVGGVPAAGIPMGTTLLEGTITNTVIAAQTPWLFSANFSGTDVKDPRLLAFLGIDPNLPFSFMTFEIAAKTDGSGSPYDASSTDVNNQGKVPEPITLVLYGVGFAGAGLYRRMRRTR